MYTTRRVVGFERHAFYFYSQTLLKRNIVKCLLGFVYYTAMQEITWNWVNVFDTSASLIWFTFIITNTRISIPNLNVLNSIFFNSYEREKGNINSFLNKKSSCKRFPFSCILNWKNIIPIIMSCVLFPSSQDLLNFAQHEEEMDGWKIHNLRLLNFKNLALLLEVYRINLFSPFLSFWWNILGCTNMI